MSWSAGRWDFVVRNDTDGEMPIRRWVRPPPPAARRPPQDSTAVCHACLTSRLCRRHHSLSGGAVQISLHTRAHVDCDGGHRGLLPASSSLETTSTTSTTALSDNVLSCGGG